MSTDHRVDDRAGDHVAQIVLDRPTIKVTELAMVLAGLVPGIVVPHAPFPRSALVSHIRFAANGMLFIVMALLLRVLPNRVTPRATLEMLVAVWLRWPMFPSQIAKAWWGNEGESWRASRSRPVPAAEAAGRNRSSRSRTSSAGLPRVSRGCCCCGASSVTCGAPRAGARAQSGDHSVAGGSAIPRWNTP